ncbi:hypothetical protein GCM10020295_69930 [Streptomyces cinereospinus]
MLARVYDLSTAPAVRRAEVASAPLGRYTRLRESQKNQNTKRVAQVPHRLFVRCVIDPESCVNVS